MNVRRLPTAPLLLLVIALLAAGCGDDGPSKAEYEAGLATVQEHLDEATEASRESGQTTEPAERSAKLEEAHAALAAAAKEAEALEPPTEAADEHERFGAALSDYADLFDKLAGLDPNDAGETELYSEAGEIADRLDKASRDLEKAGFTATEQDE